MLTLSHVSNNNTTSLVLECGRTLTLHTLGEQRGDAGFGRTGGMSSSRCKCSWPRMNTTPPHGDRAGPGDVPHGRVPDAPPLRRVPGGGRSSLRCPRTPMWLGVAGRRLSWMCGGREGEGFSSAPWSRCFTTMCRRWWNNWWTFLHPLDFRVAEQVIEVPKVVCHTPRCSHSPPRAADGRTVGGSADGASLCTGSHCRAGHWVERYSGTGGADRGVPGWRRRSGSLQGSLPGQGSTANAEQIVDIPARGGLQGFLPGQGSSTSSRLLENTDDGIQGVFRTFSRGKKVRG